MARQLLLLVLVVVVALALAIGFLAVRPSLDENVVRLIDTVFGVVIAAVVALSTTTFFANALAGLMLRSVGNFGLGDYLHVGEQFGRVTERRLLHTEIQTEDRDLATLPNLYLVQNPVKVVLRSGTIVSARLSLGYDVPHQKVAALLTEAALTVSLEKPFVHVVELGDYAVTYRVAGFLRNIEQLLTRRSRLRAAALDALHAAGVEIVSPAFMNQRPLGTHELVIPVPGEVPRGRRWRTSAASAESIMFDKAERAAQIERLATEMKEVEEEIDSMAGELAAADDDERGRRLERGIAWRKGELARFRGEHEALSALADGED